MVFKMILLVIFTASSVLSKELALIDSYRLDLYERLKSNHRPITEYSTAREYIFQKIHLEKDSIGHFVKDVYCSKIIRNNVGPTKMPDDKVVNIEHTWPQSHFEGKYAKIQKSDLHHLFPTDSKANGIRGNYEFFEFKDSGHAVLECPLSTTGTIQTNRKTGFEPPLYHKGNVARAIFYFSVRYGQSIDPIEENVLRFWNIIDPVDNEEINRNNQIEKIQGNRNLFIDDPQLADTISDF